MANMLDRDMIDTNAGTNAYSPRELMDRPGNESVDLLAAIWRYRWAVVLPAILGAVIGFLVFLRTPETYRSTTRLMLESDNDAILDSMTGELVGGVPDIEIVKSQLFSDDVLKRAFTDPRMVPFQTRFPGGINDFARLVVSDDALQLEPEVTDLKTATSLVTLLHFDSDDRELSEVAVKCFSDALQAYYNDKHRSSRSELIRLMEVATEQLHPKMTELEQRHREFRREAPLAWDSDGKAINPHRERQLFLVAKRSEMVEQLRRLETENVAVKSTAKSAEDPILGLSIIGQLLGKSLMLPTQNALRAGFGQGDEQLALVKVEQELVPLMVERNKFAAQYGSGHPTVKQLDTEISMMKSELSRVMREQTQRIGELMESGEEEKEKAKEAIAAITSGMSAQIAMLKSQVEEVEQQIEEEKTEAALLASYEQENRSLLREIEQNQKLMDQLAEQMARVKLTEEESGTQISELKAATNAYLVGPILWKMTGIGTFLGLALGGGLALLLEKNANTFRDPDEVQELLGVPVLTHVPFFKGRAKRSKKGEENPYEGLDPNLAVLHAPASVVAEAVRSLRTSIFFDMAAIRGGKILQVTSPLPGDGKSTITGNLACSIAQSGKRTLLIDCDLRRPQLTDNFDVANELGISNVLNGECDPMEACHATPLSNLDVMPSGPIPGNPAEALTLPEMNELLQLLREQYDYIVIDTPPLLVVTDPSIIASMADGVLLTLRIRRKCKINAREANNILRAVGANTLGTLINNSDESSSSDGYRGYGYYRYSRYAKKYYRRGTNGGSVRENVSPGNKHRRGLVISGRGGAPLRKAAELSSVGEVNGSVAVQNPPETNRHDSEG